MSEALFPKHFLAQRRLGSSVPTLITKVSQVTLLVRDQEEALRWYMEKLGFEKRSDDSTSVPGFRWLTIAPRHQKELEIVLGKPGSKEGMDMVGKQPGNMQGHPEAIWVLETDDCKQTYLDLKAKGVEFLSTPEERPYGVEALFKDLYGYVYDLVEPRQWQMTEQKKIIMAEAE